MLGLFGEHKMASKVKTNGSGALSWVDNSPVHNNLTTSSQITIAQNTSHTLKTLINDNSSTVHTIHIIIIIQKQKGNQH